jgi:hypothetical protein
VRRRHYSEPPWPQIILTPPAAIPAMVHTRRRLVRPRRGCFWQWVIFQADQPPVSVDLPDLSATETTLGRRTAAEQATARITGLETLTGRLASTETTTGRTEATETVMTRIETPE